MTAEERIREYYEALRAGEPLVPFFSERATVKFGVGEALFGYDAIAAALREQTRTTEDWRVESRRLEVAERDEHARFGDEVDLAWTDATDGERREFETRWSGALERENGEWAFVAMHVSAPGDA